MAAESLRRIIDDVLKSIDFSSFDITFSKWEDINIIVPDIDIDFTSYDITFKNWDSVTFKGLL